MYPPSHYTTPQFYVPRCTLCWRTPALTWTPATTTATSTSQSCNPSKPPPPLQDPSLYPLTSSVHSSSGAIFFIWVTCCGLEEGAGLRSYFVGFFMFQVAKGGRVFCAILEVCDPKGPFSLPPKKISCFLTRDFSKSVPPGRSLMKTEKMKADMICAGHTCPPPTAAGKLSGPGTGRLVSVGNWQGPWHRPICLLDFLPYLGNYHGHKYHQP